MFTYLLNNASKYLKNSVSNPFRFLFESSFLEIRKSYIRTHVKGKPINHNFWISTGIAIKAVQKKTRLKNVTQTCFQAYYLRFNLGCEKLILNLWFNYISFLVRIVFMSCFIILWNAQNINCNLIEIYSYLCDGTHPRLQCND